MRIPHKNFERSYNFPVYSEKNMSFSGYFKEHHPEIDQLSHLRRPQDETPSMINPFLKMFVIQSIGAYFYHFNSTQETRNKIFSAVDLLKQECIDNKNLNVLSIGPGVGHIEGFLEASGVKILIVPQKILNNSIKTKYCHR